MSPGRLRPQAPAKSFINSTFSSVTDIMRADIVLRSCLTCPKQEHKSFDLVLERLRKFAEIAAAPGCQNRTPGNSGQKTASAFAHAPVTWRNFDLTRGKFDFRFARTGERVQAPDADVTSGPAERPGNG